MQGTPGECANTGVGLRRPTPDLTAVTTSMSTTTPGTVPVMGEVESMPEDVDPAVDVAERATGRVRRALESSPFPILLVSLVGIVLLTVFAPSLVVGDTWLTLMAGREVVDNGLPRTETLTVLGQGATWTDQQWLAQVVFYGAHELAGMRAVVVLDVLLVVLALGLAAAAARSGGASSRSTFVVGLLAVLAGPWGWTIRAQTAALPLFAGVLWLLVDAARRGVRRRTLLVLPALVVWANLHGSVVLGAILTMLLAGYALVRDAPARLALTRAARPRPALRPRDAVRVGRRRVLRADARRRAVRGDPPRVAVVEPERDDGALLRARGRRPSPSSRSDAAAAA